VIEALTMRPLLILFAVAILAYGGICILAYLGQDRMIFFPTRSLTDSPAHHNLLFETISLRTSDGEALLAWWIPASPEKGVLIFCHGNAGNISGRLESARQFHDLGLSVLLFDYRGYGESTGKPSEKGLYTDGEAAYTYVTEQRGIDPARVVVFGRSLGAAVATSIASKHLTGAVMLESPFTSAPDLAAEIYPYLPVRLLARYRFDNLSRMDRLQTAGVLIAHSTDDRIVPYGHGRRLYDAVRSNKRFLDLEGNHNNGFIETGERYSEEIRDFLGAYLWMYASG
jgi:fermentation-respiration switch protein FrsA (DUF1100 family)